MQLSKACSVLSTIVRRLLNYIGTPVYQARTSLHTYIHTYIHTWVYIHAHTYIHTYIHESTYTRLSSLKQESFYRLTIPILKVSFEWGRQPLNDSQRVWQPSVRRRCCFRCCYCTKYLQFISSEHFYSGGHKTLEMSRPSDAGTRSRDRTVAENHSKRKIGGN
jgi:hypothetical protein